MRTGLDFKSAQFGGFEMTSHTNKVLIKVRWIDFDPVQGMN
jgi:hypothetical protein